MPSKKRRRSAVKKAPKTVIEASDVAAPSEEAETAAGILPATVTNSAEPIIAPQKKVNGRRKRLQPAAVEVVGEPTDQATSAVCAGNPVGQVDPLATLLASPPKIRRPVVEEPIAGRPAVEKRTRKPAKKTEIVTVTKPAVDRPTKAPKATRASKKVKRGRGRPRNQAIVRDAESGAVHNFTRTAVIGKRRLKRDIGKTSSMIWLSFWTDEQKKQLLDAATLYGTDCDLKILKEHIPSRSIQDIKLFMDLLRENGKKIVTSAEFKLSCGMSAIETMKCRDPFVRIPAGPSIQETTPIYDCLKQAFLAAVETTDVMDTIEPNTADFDRIYRVLAYSLHPDTSVTTLRSMCTDSDLTFIRLLLDQIILLATRSPEREDDIFAVLRSRLRINMEELPFSTDIPPGPYGETARNLACLPDLNPLRLRPIDLFFANPRTETGTEAVVAPESEMEPLID